jgi:hypothetical protein
MLRVLPMQSLTKNGEMKVLFTEFHRRTNLTELLFEF